MISIQRWRMGWIGALLAVWALVLPAQAQEGDATAAIERAVTYIRAQQQPDGSFSGFGPGSTADAVYALNAANVDIDPATFAYMRAQAAQANNDTGLVAKFTIALALEAQALTLPDNTPLVDVIERGYSADTGQYGADVTAHAYALVALKAATDSIRPEAVDALKRLQLPDGGWSFDGSADGGSDTNTTGLALQALAAAGDQSDAIGRAVAYLRTQQNADGGFPYAQTSEFGNASDANSTALAIQGLLAAGEDPATWTRDNGATPLSRLLAFQNNSGAFRYQDAAADDNAFATYQAVPALAGEPLPQGPIAVALPAPVAATPAPTSPAAPQPTSAPAPTTPPAGGPPATLPNTGAHDLLPVFATIAVALLLGGVALRRRRA
jgi:LPXTG-motif cell wall-anchored protein